MNRTTRRHRRRGGFTLIELIIVIAVIGVLIALLLPAVQAARGAARRARCVSNLKQIALATHHYAEAVGTLPMGGLYRRASDGSDEWWPSAGHFVALLPYLEQQPLFHAVNFDVLMWSAPNTTVTATGLDILWCPSDPEAHRATRIGEHVVADMTNQWARYTSYVGNAALFLDHGSAPWIAGSPRRFAHITDGTSQTILFGEKAHTVFVKTDERVASEWHWWASGHYWDTRFSDWFPPNAYRTYDPANFLRHYAMLDGASSLHPDGANFAFADGSVRFLKESINSWKADGASEWWTHPGTYQFLMSPSGGEVIDAVSY